MPFSPLLDAPSTFSGEASEARRLAAYLLIKRVGDVLLASLALMALLPLFALIALAISIEDRGPILFRQTRIGKGGRPFG